MKRRPTPIDTEDDQVVEEIIMAFLQRKGDEETRLELIKYLEKECGITKEQLQTQTIQERRRLFNLQSEKISQWIPKLIRL